MIIVPKELPMKEFLRFFLIFSPSFLFVIYSSLSPYNDAPEYVYSILFKSTKLFYKLKITMQFINYVTIKHKLN